MLWRNPIFHTSPLQNWRCRMDIPQCCPSQVVFSFRAWASSTLLSDPCKLCSNKQTRGGQYHSNYCSGSNDTKEIHSMGWWGSWAVLLPIAAWIGCICVENALQYLWGQWWTCWQCRVVTLCTMYIPAHILTEKFINSVFWQVKKKRYATASPLSFLPSIASPIHAEYVALLPLFFFSCRRGHRQDDSDSLFCGCPYQHHDSFQTTVYMKSPDLRATNYKLLRIQSSAKHWVFLYPEFFWLLWTLGHIYARSKPEASSARGAMPELRNAGCYAHSWVWHAQVSNLIVL